MRVTCLAHQILPAYTTLSEGSIGKEKGPMCACAVALPGAFSWKVFAEGTYSPQRAQPIAPCEVICLAHFLRSPQPLVRSSATPARGTVRLE
jgi:hypothetical protein